ncbi:MAG: hypothetical protein LUE98_17695 [Tannerellaceae bacterium]|nr:hypothetical protein [Tannerellaceae bacterium]
MSNNGITKVEFAVYNFYDIVEYLLDNGGPNEEIELIDFQEIIENFFINFTNSKIIYKNIEPDLLIEYTPQLSFLINNSLLTSYLAVLANIRVGNLAFTLYKNSNENWAGEYIISDNINLKELDKIKSLAEIQELIRSKKAK